MIREEEERLIRKVLTTGRYTLSELKTLYRILSKFTHPDMTGGDGERFIRLKEAYEAALRRKDLKGRGPLFLEDRTPEEVVRECGYTGEISPRLGLYLSLYRYLTLGLHSYRIRHNPALHERNERVLRAIRHWATVYDPSFLSTFETMMEQYLPGITTMKHLRWYLSGRKSFFTALRLFLKYQETGRTSTGRVARDRSLWVITMGGRIPGLDPYVRMSRWLLDELAKPPLQFGSEGPHM